MIILAKKFSNLILKEAKKTELKDIILCFAELAYILNQSDVFGRMIFSPSLANADKHKAILKLFAKSGVEVPNLASKIIRMLIERKKISLIPQIVTSLEYASLKSKGRCKTKLVFADKPSNSQLEVVEKSLIEKFKIDPEIQLETDSKIVAGFVALFDGKMLDASLYNAFNDLTKLRIE